MLKALIFDLDMTLIDSSIAQNARQARRWDHAISLIPIFKPFQARSGTYVHDIPRLLKERGLKIGIVTSSPRAYAQKVISNFNIYYDILIAYHDTQNHKPDPEPINKALQELGTKAEEVIYIGDATEDFRAASSACVYSVAALWGSGGVSHLTSDMPDAFLSSSDNILDNLDNFTLISELVFRRTTPPSVGGIYVMCDPAYPIFTLGRYFQTGDIRHSKHRLSSEIIKLKNEDTSIDKFAFSLLRYIEMAKKTGFSPDYVVPVPHKPDQRNRFVNILCKLKQFAQARDLDFQIDPEGLYCKEGVPNYKGLGAQDRADSISGTIDTKFNWEECSVLVVDDVFTSGATMRECIDILKRNSSGEVRGVVFGKDQFNRNPTICTSCGSTMRTRVNRSTGERFLGCSNYPNCRHTQPIPR